MDDFITKLMQEQFGRHRGGLWRSDRSWYVYGAKDPMQMVKAVAENVKGKRQGLYDKDGFTKKRLGRWMGDIPMEIAFANPELMTDPNEARRFFKEHPEFSSKGR